MSLPCRLPATCRARNKFPAIRVKVHWLLRDARPDRGLCDGVAHLDEEASVERLGDDVARTELQLLVRVERLHLGGDRLAR